MGYVRTNAPMKLGSGGGGGGGGGSGTQDLPTHLNSISANAGNQHVTLTLEYSNTDLVDGVQVNYKTGGYPTSPTDGEFVTENGAATSILIEGLTNSLTYYFRVFLYNEVDGAKYYQTDLTNAQITAIPRTVEITGITPLVEAADHIVIVESGSGTISAPAGTKIILGSGGQTAFAWDGGRGGFVQEVTLDNDVNSQTITATIAAEGTSAGTKLTIGEQLYDCGKTAQIIQSKWGPIGGDGGRAGNGGRINQSGDSGYDGTGAGGGGGGGGAGGGISGTTGGSGGTGGNADGYGNKGENGTNGTSNPHGHDNGQDGGNGGNGGYAAGGGGGGDGGTAYTDEENEYYRDDGYQGTPGKGGTGIIVIQWD